MIRYFRILGVFFGILFTATNTLVCFAEQVVLQDKEAEEQFNSIRQQKVLLANSQTAYQKALEKINLLIDELPCGSGFTKTPRPSVLTSLTKAANEEFTCYRQTLLTGYQRGFCENIVIQAESFYCVSSVEE